MDFGALLHYAKKKNDAATKEDEVCISYTKHNRLWVYYCCIWFGYGCTRGTWCYLLLPATACKLHAASETFPYGKCRLLRVIDDSIWVIR